MRSSQERSTARLVWLLPALLLCGGCRIVDARVSNLRNLHDAEGRVKRVAAVESDFGYLMRQFLASMRFQGNDNAFAAKEKRLDDPNLESLENLIALGEEPSDDDRVVGLQAELFSWLAVDCNYALSRERATLNLHRVGRALGLEDPSKPLEEEQATQPGIALEWLRGLREALEPFLSGQTSGYSPTQAADAIGAVDVTALDLDGARRLLRATNVWFESKRFQEPSLSSLRELRRELAKRSVELALARALSDPHPFVRAAALESCVRLSDNKLPRLLRAALSEADPEIVVRALRLLAEYGVPTKIEPDFGGDAIDYLDAWIDLVMRLLRVAPDGPVAVAGCKALARITEAGFEDLRPEVWADWWEEYNAELAAEEVSG